MRLQFTLKVKLAYNGISSRELWCVYLWCVCEVANFVVQFIELFSDFWLLKKKKNHFKGWIKNSLCAVTKIELPSFECSRLHTDYPRCDWMRVFLYSICIFLRRAWDKCFLLTITTTTSMLPSYHSLSFKVKVLLPPSILISTPHCYHKV